MQPSDPADFYGISGAVIDHDISSPAKFSWAFSCTIFFSLTYILMVILLKRRLKYFFFNSLLIVISSLILQIIKLSFNIYISNKITPEALGVFQLIMVTYYFGITLSSSGINISCMRVVSEEYALGNFDGIKKASKKCINISIILSSIASFIFYINSDFIVYKCFQNKVSSNIVYLICFALPLISVSSAISGYFLAVRKAYQTVIAQFLEQLSKIIAIIVLFSITLNNSLETICFSLILGDVISELIAFIYLLIAYNMDLKINFLSFKILAKEKYFKRIIKILLPISFTSCIKSGISSIKQLIIPSSLERNGKSSNKALSEYGIISGMAMPIIMFPSTFLIAVANLLIPEFSRYYVKKDYNKIKFYTDRLLVGTFLFSFFITLFYLILGNKLGIILYNNYDARYLYKNTIAINPFYVC